MAALFHRYGSGGMLKNSVGPYASPAQISILTQLVDPTWTAIITQIGITINDTLQFFPSFDDFIHYYWFGKGLGNMTVQGMLFGDCKTQRLTGADYLMPKISQARGKITHCSIEQYWFSGVVTDFNLTVVSEPETHAVFTINFAMTDHSLPSPPPNIPGC